MFLASKCKKRMQIQIENPCHENWNNMLPDELGAYCLACQKTVVDFSQKTTQEIKEFFSSQIQKDKVCGRFRSQQLNPINFEQFFIKFKHWNFPKKMTIILFFSFGMTLFSCKTIHEPIMGDIAIENNLHDDNVLMGKVVPVQDTTVITIPDTLNQESRYKMGEVIALPPESLAPQN